jgi:hypothetical protein
MWVNLYGPSVSGDPKISEKISKNGNKYGSTYWGRILVRLSSRNEVNPLSHVMNLKNRVPLIVNPNPV